MTGTSIRFAAACAWLALLVSSACAHAASPEVRAWLDRDTMQLGETVTLNVQTGDANATRPDFSTLAQDFNLLDTQSSQQMRIVNGARSATMLWAIGLEPRHAGHITIAPISVGNARTAPIGLDVTAPTTKASAKAGDDVFIEVAADPLTPYVQQEVRYTVKLYYAFDLTGGSLAEPHADGLGIRRLGQDKSYVATLAGRQYQVVERHYALTPEHSGTIDIAALAFRGTALDRSDPTGFFSRGREVVARSEAIALEVKPKPAQWTDGTWLPAASLLLKDETELPGEVHVGDPLTRTIRLQAQGLAYEQLPELTLATPDGAQMYPDKPDTRTRDDGEWTYGERVRKFAFVPSQAGTLTIPGLKLAWWNTATDQQEIAQLPPRTIRVLPAPGTSVMPTAAPAAVAPSAVTPAMSPASPTPAATVAGTTQDRVRLWRALAISAFLLWLITLALWWRARRGTHTRAVEPAARALDSSTQRAAFLRACSLGDFAAAERALVGWARHERAQVRNLGELAGALDDAAQRDAVDDLQRTRYAGMSTLGLAARLQQAFKRGLAWRGEVAMRSTQSVLPALYPERE